MSNTNDQPRRLMLQIPRDEVQKQIEVQIKQGYTILHTRIGSDVGLSKCKDRGKKWNDYNKQLLKSFVNTDDLYIEYIEPFPSYDVTVVTGFNKDTDIFRYELKHLIQRLESIYQRLELLPEAPKNSNSREGQESTRTVPREIGRRVFIVHGHDEGAKYAVARFIQQLGLKAIILQEQSEQGRTIIEKFEDYADVDFAVVLLTPDDVGASQKTPDKTQPRARQNVILELGFFIGKLGRERVCALYKGEVERPSDIAGILWTRMDDHRGWQLSLVREMKQAGLDVDVNKLLG